MDAIQYAPAIAALEGLNGLVADAAKTAGDGADAAEWKWAMATVLSRTLRLKGRRMMLPAVRVQPQPSAQTAGA